LSDASDFRKKRKYILAPIIIVDGFIIAQPLPISKVF